MIFCTEDWFVSFSTHSPIGTQESDQLHRLFGDTRVSNQRFGVILCTLVVESSTSLSRLYRTGLELNWGHDTFWACSFSHRRISFFRRDGWSRATYWYSRLGPHIDCSVGHRFGSWNDFSRRPHQHARRLRILSPPMEWNFLFNILPTLSNLFSEFDRFHP